MYSGIRNRLQVGGSKSINSRDEAGTRRRWKKNRRPQLSLLRTIPRFHTDKVRETSESIKESPPPSLLPVTSRPLFSIAQLSSPLVVLLFAESQSLKKFFFPRTPRLLRRVKHKSDYSVHANQSPSSHLLLLFFLRFTGNEATRPSPREGSAGIPRMGDETARGRRRFGKYRDFFEERERGKGERRIDERGRMDISLGDRGGSPRDD